MPELTSQFENQCPAVEQWQAFLLGQVSLEQVDSFAEHLKQCSNCESQLDELRPTISPFPKGTDEFLDIVQEVVLESEKSPLDRFFHESACNKLPQLNLADLGRPTASARLGDTDADVIDAQPASTIELPQTVGKYEIIKLIGRGGFGYVFKAYNPDLDIHVALKVPRSETESQKRIKTLVKEAQTLAKLNHPNIVGVYDAGTDEAGNSFVAMEWIEGETLLERIRRRGVLPESEVLSMANDVAQALGFLHSKGYTHRDLKPDNILIDRDGKALLADFGLAMHDSSQHLHRGEYAGTTAYMAPEQIRREANDGDGRIDIWALGVLMYVCLTGKRPFGGDSQDELRRQILERTPRPPSQWRTSISQHVEALVLSCLEKQIDARPQSAREFILATQQQPQVKLKSSLIMPVAATTLLCSAIITLGILYFSGVLQKSTGQNNNNKTDVLSPLKTHEVSINKTLIEDLNDNQLLLSAKRPSFRTVSKITPDTNELRFEFTPRKNQGKYGVFLMGQDGRVAALYLSTDKGSGSKAFLVAIYEFAEEDSEPVIKVEKNAKSFSLKPSDFETPTTEFVIRFDNKKITEIKLNGLPFTTVGDILSRNRFELYGSFGVSLSNTLVFLEKVLIDGEVYEFKAR